tara:strand:- start:253 stop:474 length:222 start_codon:yes stop_codon:yes gene_type:complete
VDDTLGLWREVCAEWVQPFFGDIMKVGDLVKHKYINKIGVIHKVWMNYRFVQWADGSRQQHHQRDLRAVKKCP